MIEIVVGVIMLVIGLLILDHNREFAMPQVLDLIPAIFVVFGAVAIAAGVFRIA